MTYPLKFRKHVLKIRANEKLTLQETSVRFKVGIASLVRWLKRLEANQSKPRIRKLNMQALRQDIKDYPDAYLYERAARFGVAVNSIWHGLKKLDVTYKKSAKTSQGRRRQTAHIQEQD